MSAEQRKRVLEIAERMRGLAMTLRVYTSTREQKISVEMVEKWAEEIERCLEGDE